MKSGIYKILNLLNGKCYIGSSEYLSRRLKDHRVYLKNNTHPCRHLQNSYNKYGISAFVYGIIEYCEVEDLLKNEQYWIDKTHISVRYNKRVIAESNKGFKFSEESKEKLRKRKVWNKGKTGMLATSGCIKKGQRISIKTEFKKGLLPWNKERTGLQKEDIIDGKRRKISFMLVSPNGVLYEGICLKWFADEMNISYSLLQNVIKNNKSYQSGWRLPQKNDIYEGYGTFLK